MADSSVVSPLFLLEDQADRRGGHVRAAPVVQIIVKITVADAELERLQKSLVLHQIESVENVETGILGRDQSVAHQLVPRCRRRRVVERVSRFQGLVDRMVHHRRRQSVVAHHVGDDAVLLHDITIDDAGARKEPVAEILLVETRCQVELVQILLVQIERHAKKDDINIWA